MEGPADYQVLMLVTEEMQRTVANHETGEPTVNDYLVDLVRFLDRQLPLKESFLKEQRI